MAPQVIPARGSLPDYRADARAAFEIIKAGGTIIVPASVGTPEAVERAFTAKQRREGHTMGIIGNWHTHAALHDLPAAKLAMTRVLTEELGLHLVVVAKVNWDAPLLKDLSPQVRHRAFQGDTAAIAIVTWEGPFLRELTRLCYEENVLLVGSSANLSGRGQKARLEDIEKEVVEPMTAVIDYGMQIHGHYKLPGTILDLENMKTLRVGVAYELLRERMKKWFGIQLADGPDGQTVGAQLDDGVQKAIEAQKANGIHKANGIPVAVTA